MCGYRDTEFTGAQQRLPRPGVEFERVAPDDRQRRDPMGSGLEPIGNHASQVGLAANRPVEAERPGVGVREPVGDAGIEVAFALHAVGQVGAQRQQPFA